MELVEALGNEPRFIVDALALRNLKRVWVVIECALTGSSAMFGQARVGKAFGDLIRERVEGSDRAIITSQNELCCWRSRSGVISLENLGDALRICTSKTPDGAIGVDIERQFIGVDLIEEATMRRVALMEFIDQDYLMA